GMVSQAQRQAIRKPTATSVEPIGNLSGFGPMTRISTSFGDMHAQALRERDMVRTRTGGFVKIERVDRYVLDEEFLRYHPEALPIRIRAGAFGRNLPANDVTLAPFQTINTSQPIAGPRVARAIDALGRPSVMRVPETIFTYTVIRCARPVSVLCEGLWIDI
ncbi:MAG: Hint domain-containing protein, partial [Paracoccaceae bacterium]